MVIRPATEADIPAILALARIYMDESAYGYTFDVARSDRLIRAYLADEFHAVVVAEVEGNLAGIWIAAIIYEWMVEPLCYVSKFYTLPAYRGLGVGSALFGALTDWTDTNGVMDTFVASTANMDKSESFTALAEAHGFIPLGPTMVRRKPQQQ